LYQRGKAVNRTAQISVTDDEIDPLIWRKIVQNIAFTRAKNVSGSMSDSSEIWRSFFPMRISDWVNCWGTFRGTMAGASTNCSQLFFSRQ
jgi:hypothetical protein